MEWAFTMLAVHVVWLIGAATLFRAAPCWMQKLVVALLVGTMGLIGWGYLLAVLGNESWDEFRLAGLALGHVANLLYVFRVWWQNHQRLHAEQLRETSIASVIPFR